MTLRASPLSGDRLFGHRSPSSSWSRLHGPTGRQLSVQHKLLNLEMLN